MLHFPSSRRSRLRFAALERSGTFPTSHMSWICRSMSSPKVCLGCPCNVAPQESLAYVATFTADLDTPGTG